MLKTARTMKALRRRKAERRMVAVRGDKFANSGVSREQAFEVLLWGAQQLVHLSQLVLPPIANGGRPVKSQEGFCGHHCATL